jgi:hypothetical protein
MARHSACDGVRAEEGRAIGCSEPTDGPAIRDLTRITLDRLFRPWVACMIERETRDGLAKRLADDCELWLTCH